MAWTWSKLESETEVIGTRKIYNDRECEECCREIGFKKLPETYIEYVKRFGFGEWQAGLFIGVPKNNAETATLKYSILSWREANKKISHKKYPFILDRNLREREEAKPLSPLLLKFSRLIQFGGFGDGYCIYWDTDRICANGDMFICIANARDRKLCSFEGTLLQFLGESMVEGKLNSICPQVGAKWDCRPIFRVL